MLTNIFRHLQQATVLMIAHRLETAVKYCDFILVLDKGQLVEYEEPWKLLVTKDEDT